MGNLGEMKQLKMVFYEGKWEDNLESLSKNPGNRNTQGRNSDTIILHRNKPKLDVIQAQ